VGNIPKHQGNTSEEFLTISHVVDEGLIKRLRVCLDSRNITIWQGGELTCPPSLVQG
jgi:hypothetical protein